MKNLAMSNKEIVFFHNSRLINNNNNNNNNNNFISFEHDMLSCTTVAVPLSITVIYNLNCLEEGGREASKLVSRGC